MELLLQPGGSVLAVALWLYTKAKTGARSATGLLAESKLLATKMSSPTGGPRATHLAERLDHKGSKVVAHWSNCGKLQTCSRGGGTRS
jgi:hypothetical protein